MKRRYLQTILAAVLFLLALGLTLYPVVSNYYNSARSTLMAKAKAGADYFNTYSTDSYSAYYRG